MFRLLTRDKKPDRGVNASDLWLYARYQLLSKALIIIALSPLYTMLTRGLIAVSGRSSISSGDFKGFIFSLPGLILIALTIVSVTVLVVIDLVAFVVAEMMRLRGEPLPTARALLWRSLEQLPRFFHPGTLVLVAYFALVVPLIGIGPSLSELNWVTIPAFVSDVIEKNALYLSVYMVCLVLLAIVGFLLATTIPAMLIDDLDPFHAMITSWRFTVTHWRHLLMMMLRSLVSVALMVAAVETMILLALFVATLVIPHSAFTERFIVLVGVLSLLAGIGTLITLAAPLQLRDSTRHYAEETAKGRVAYRDDLMRLEDSSARPRLIAAALIGVSGVVIASGALAMFFDDVFPPTSPSAVVAHRGGGDLDAENSLAGLEAAIAHGAQWSEIDVQRTMDGHYIIHHDATFKRLAGESRTAQEMTLAEIQQLQIANTFTPASPSRPVATVEEMLDAAKGRTGLFIELKSPSADRAMVDDLAEMIHQRGMSESVALISLNLDLVRYSKQAHPELPTGYLYYFSVGDMSTIPADYLMMEEGLASDKTVDAVHASGKKAIVWTVNSDQSIERAVSSPVDGIITDHPTRVIRSLSLQAVRTNLGRVIHEFFS